MEGGLSILEQKIWAKIGVDFFYITTLSNSGTLAVGVTNLSPSSHFAPFGAFVLQVTTIGYLRVLHSSVQDTQPADDSQATEPINEGSMWPEYEVEEDEEDDNDNDDDEDDEDEEVEEEQEDNGKVDEEAAEEEDAQSPQETPRENTQTAGDLSEADTKQNDLGVAGNSTAVADSGGNTQSVQGADELQQAAPNQEEELPNDHPEGLQEVPEDILDEYCEKVSTSEPSDLSRPESIGDFELNQIPNFIAILAFN